MRSTVCRNSQPRPSRNKLNGETKASGIPEAESGQSSLSLLFSAGSGRNDLLRFCRRFLHSEIVVIVKIAIHDAGKLRGLGSKGRPSAFQKDHGDDPPILRDRKSTR